MLAVLVVCLVVLAGTAKGEVRACYYGTWEVWRDKPAGLDIPDLDPDLCTHIMVAYVRVGADYRITYYTSEDAQGPTLDSAVTLKQKNPSLKVMVAVGGRAHSVYPFQDMAKASGGPAKFATSAVEFLNKHALDGLSVDWEHPEGYIKEFSDVVKALRAEFDADEQTTGKKLLLTAAVTADTAKADKCYEYAVLNSALDYVFLMTYDLTGHWELHTGHQSALYKGKHQVSTSANHYSTQGMSIDKIVVGFPLYGRSFKLESASTHGVGAPAVAYNGPHGKYTDSPGVLAYYEICRNLAGKANYIWDDEAKASYLYNDTTWVSFDSKQAICHKLRWLTTNGYQGWVVWSMATDDHANMCGQGKNPMLSYLKNYVGKQLSEDDCNAASLKPRITTYSGGSGGDGESPHTNFCGNKIDDIYVDTSSCKRYIQCLQRGTLNKNCPSGLIFNGDTNVCDWPLNVDCSMNYIPTPKPYTGKIYTDRGYTTKYGYTTTGSTANTPKEEHTGLTTGSLVAGIFITIVVVLVTFGAVMYVRSRRAMAGDVPPAQGTDKGGGAIVPPHSNIDSGSAVTPISTSSTGTLDGAGWGKGRDIARSSRRNDGYTSSHTYPEGGTPLPSPSKEGYASSHKNSERVNRKSKRRNDDYEYQSNKADSTDAHI